LKWPFLFENSKPYLDVDDIILLLNGIFTQISNHNEKWITLYNYDRYFFYIYIFNYYLKKRVYGIFENKE
jgi:hypothetical protein